MKNLENKKLKWVNPVLESLCGIQLTKGACENGSGNAGCATGVSATTLCGAGTGGVGLPTCVPFGAAP